MRQSGLCQVTCQECLLEGKTSADIGETVRTIYGRGVEHLQANSRRDQESVLVEHEQVEHGHLDHEGRGFPQWKPHETGAGGPSDIHQQQEDEPPK